MTTLKSFIESSSIPAALIRAVVRQVGGWDQFQEIAQDVARHGADGGWSGFIYHEDTVAFTKKNKAALMELIADQANDYGAASPAVFVGGFRCLQDEQAGEVEQALYTGKGPAAQAVYNALAWYALEEVCRAYDDGRG